MYSTSCATIHHGPRESYKNLGSFSTPEEAAQAYDVASVQRDGAASVTNFSLDMYLSMLGGGGRQRRRAAQEGEQSRREVGTNGHRVIQGELGASCGYGKPAEDESSSDDESGSGSDDDDDEEDGESGSGESGNDS